MYVFMYHNLWEHGPAGAHSGYLFRKKIRYLGMGIFRTSLLCFFCIVAKWLQRLNGVVHNLLVVCWLCEILP